MTKRILWISVITAAFLFSGCDSGEEQKPRTATPQVVKPDKPIETPVPKPAEDTAKDTPPVVVNEDVKAAVEEASKAASETAKEAVEKTSVAIEETVKAAEDKAVAVEKKATEVSSAAVTAVTAKASGPDEVVLEASYGKVTLPHAMHAEAYACSNCHGDSAPGAMELGKDAAHTLCRGCHKDEGVGPTGCKDCHKK